MEPVANARLRPVESHTDMLLALFLGLITTLATLLGSYLAVLPKHPSARTISAAIAFGGGFILAAAILELAPEVIGRGEHMPAFIAIGFMLVYLSEHTLNVHLHKLPAETEDKGQRHNIEMRHIHKPSHTTLIATQTGLASLVAFNLHDFTDGLAIGAAMISGRGIGIMVFLAVLVHEIPAGFTIASIMRGAGRSRKASFLSGLSIGLITLVGITLPFLLGSINSFTTDLFLALATGTFIYLGASILIPTAETGGYRWSFVYVALGFVLFYVSTLILGLFLEI